MRTVKAFLLISLWAVSPLQGQPAEFAIEIPPFVVSGIPFEMTLRALQADGSIDTSYSGSPEIHGVYQKTDGQLVELRSTGNFLRGELTLSKLVIKEFGTRVISLRDGDVFRQVKIRVLPGFLSLLPPLIAILLALTARQVLLALFCGVWLGAIFINNYNPLIGFMRALDTYVVGALADSSHAAIVIFTLTLGGMIGIISKSGGTQGIVERIAKYADHPRGGQLATWAMGLFIFFDDYANTLIVGNTMRPFTDRLRISREKLSYIVDSTAAPVASIALISTWIGFEVGLIKASFDTIGLQRDAYITFIECIPYRTYSILTIVMVFLVGLSLRDFGSMYKAEHRAWTTGKVLRDRAQPLTDAEALSVMAKEGTPLRPYNAILPVMTVILVTLFGLYYSGRAQLGPELAAKASLREIFGKADSFPVLLWASFSGAILAGLLAISQRILTLRETIEAWISGVKAMVLAMLILTLAWSIGKICEDLKTADYVIAVTRGLFSPHLLPLLTFLVAAFIGFSTGTSWATMAILVPIVIPMAYKLTAEINLDPSIANSILLGTLGAVLAGSTFGDHCSPISDTTIMSSMASSADHIDHVNTQLPYALTVALVSCLVGYLPAGYGFSPGISLSIGTGILVVILFTLGKRITR